MLSAGYAALLGGCAKSLANRLELLSCLVVALAHPLQLGGPAPNLQSRTLAGNGERETGSGYRNCHAETSARARIAILVAGCGRHGWVVGYVAIAPRSVLSIPPVSSGEQRRATAAERAALVRDLARLESVSFHMERVPI